MNLAYTKMNDPAALSAVVTTLRRLYKPQFEVEAALATALDAIDRNEQNAMARIASMSRARAPSVTTA